MPTKRPKRKRPEVPVAVPETSQEVPERLVAADPPLALQGAATAPSEDLVERLGGAFRHRAEGEHLVPESPEFYLDQLLERVEHIDTLMKTGSTRARDTLRAITQAGVSLTRLREHFQTQAMKGL